MTPTPDTQPREEAVTDRYHKRPFTGFAPRDDKRRKQIVTLPMDVILAIVRERLECLQHGSDHDAVAQHTACEIESAMGVFPNLEGALSASPAAGGVDAVAVTDWLAVAKAAGHHGIRYRTNRALEAFLTDVRASLSPAPTSGSGEDMAERIAEVLRRTEFEKHFGMNKRDASTAAKAIVEALTLPTSGAEAGGELERLRRELDIGRCASGRYFTRQECETLHHALATPAPSPAGGVREAGFSTIEAAYIRGATWSLEMGMHYKIEELWKAAYDYADKKTSLAARGGKRGDVVGQCHRCGMEMSWRYNCPNRPDPLDGDLDAELP